MKLQLIHVERFAIVALALAAGYFAGRSNAPAGAPGSDLLHADGTAVANQRMVAVTGPYQQGVSLLYIIDTETKQLAVYEARGGSRSSGRITFVGARRIDLDLKLEGYHDDSEFSYGDLASHFRKSGWIPSPDEKGSAPDPSKPDGKNKPPEKPTDK